MDEHTEYLPEDVYRFMGRDIGIVSNSHEILAHFKSVYGRFHSCEGRSASRAARTPAETHRPVIKVTDNLRGSNEIIVDNGSEYYRLKCRNIHEFDYDYYALAGTVPNPLAHIDAVFTMKVYDLAKEYHMFHGGAVSRADAGIIFPGFSGMGKSTLTLNLVKHGFGFLSDEAACIDAEKETLHPFCLKLKLSPDSLRLLNMDAPPGGCIQETGFGEMEYVLDIEDMMPASIACPCPLRLVFFLQGFGERCRLEFVSPANALFRLLRYSLLPVEDPAELLYRFAPLVDRVSCFNLVMGGPDETVDAIARLVDAGDQGNQGRAT